MSLILVSLALFAAVAVGIARSGALALDLSTHAAVRDLVSGSTRAALIAETARDFTALGSNGVLSVLTLLSVVGLLIAGRRGGAATLLAACSGGLVLVGLAKLGFSRPRPDAVPGVTVFTTSFPSSHATMSAAVYLAMAGVAASLSRRRRWTVFVFAAAIVTGLIVGASRIVLGVHWLSDVLAGWALGSAWGLSCCLFAVRALARETERGTPSE